MPTIIPKSTPTPTTIASSSMLVGGSSSSKLGLPERMDLASLMMWLSNKMRDSDANIRAKMADMNDRKVIQKELNDLVIAFRESRTGKDWGDGYVGVKATLDNPDAIRKSAWFNALDTTTRDQVDTMLSAVHMPAYRFIGKSYTATDGSKYATGDWVDPSVIGEVDENFEPLGTRISKDQIDRAVQSLGDISKNLSSNDEIQMIELQSTISARGQLLQMVSNMIASFNETAKNIAGNMRG
jgi:hypothetical protein